MTIENPFESKKQKSTTLVNYYEPKTSSRFYAFFIDNLWIYQPITYFLTAPIIELKNENAFYELGYSSGLYIELLIILYFLIATLLSSFLTYIFSATPGQKLFGLKVVNTEVQSKLTLWTCFVRSLSFYLQMFIFFFPCLNLVSSPVSLHGQMSNTRLKSTSPGVFKPLISSKTLRIFYTIVFVFFLFSISSFIIDIIKAPKEFQAINNSCGDIKSLNLHKMVNTWNDKLAPSLIYVLYKNKDINKSCFRDYLNEYISVNDSKKEGMYYLWLTEDSSVVKNKYEKYICKNKNPYCALINNKLNLKITDNFSELNDIEMSYLFKSIKYNEDTMNWDQLVKYNSLTSVLSWLPNLRDKTYYLLSKNLKPSKYSSYISNEYVESKTSHKVYAMATVDACYSELLNSCNIESIYCSDFVDNVSKKSQLNFYDQINLSYMSYCDKKFKPQLIGWDKEKYLKLFLNVVSTDQLYKLNTIVKSTYSHPRLKMASLSILINKGKEIGKLNQYVSDLNMNFVNDSSVRKPSSVKSDYRGEK